MGEDADRLVLGLAGAGLAVTAATYVSAGGAAPVRAGLSMVKDARKLGRLGEGLTEWAGRSARGVVDAPALQQAVATASIAHPGQAITAMKAAFKAEKGRCSLFASPRMSVAWVKKQGHVARSMCCGLLTVRKMSHALLASRRRRARQTRAILKILGRGALLLTMGAFNLAWWMFAACFADFRLSFVDQVRNRTADALCGCIAQNVNMHSAIWWWHKHLVQYRRSRTAGDPRQARLVS